MNFKLQSLLILGIASLALLSLDVYAKDKPIKVKLSTGYNFTSGDYGGTQDIEDTYIPLTVSADKGRYGFRLTVPYLRVRAPSGTIFTDTGGQPIAGAGELTTESGLGDVIASVTVYDVIKERDAGFALDITGKVKFGTADDAKGLGTGEQDYALQANLYKSLGQFSILASAGYKVRGDPDDIELENSALASLGGIYKLNDRTRSGLIYDYRESAFSDGDSIQELTAFVSRKVSNDWRVQIYALTGFSDSSPDWGGGILLKKYL